MTDNEIGLKIHILSRKIKRNMNLVLHKYSLTSVQGAILGYIYKKTKIGLVYARDIEKEFDMRRATTTGILQLMEKQGLIERKLENTDARLKSITLTQKALKIQKEIEEEIKVSEEKLKKGLTSKEIENFTKILSKMSKNIN